MAPEMTVAVGGFQGCWLEWDIFAFSLQANYDFIQSDFCSLKYLNIGENLRNKLFFCLLWGNVDFCKFSFSDSRKYIFLVAGTKSAESRQRVFKTAQTVFSQMKNPEMTWPVPTLSSASTNSTLEL